MLDDLQSLGGLIADDRALLSHYGPQHPAGAGLFGRSLILLIFILFIPLLFPIIFLLPLPLLLLLLLLLVLLLPNLFMTREPMKYIPRPSSKPFIPTIKAKKTTPAMAAYFGTVLPQISIVPPIIDDDDDDDEASAVGDLSPCSLPPNKGRSEEETTTPLTILVIGLLENANL